MSEANVAPISRCPELRRALLLCPPRAVHGTVLLLGLLVAAAVIWAALTRAELVVVAPGRVRPLGDGRWGTSTPAEGRPVVAAVPGRVARIAVDEGALVREGDVVVILEDPSLDDELGLARRRLRTSEGELAELEALRRALPAELDVAVSKARAELEEAREGLTKLRAEGATEVRRAEDDLAWARAELDRVVILQERRIRRIESELDSARAEEAHWVSRRDAQTALADLELEGSRRELARVERLVACGAAPREELERRHLAVRRAEEVRAAARAPTELVTLGSRIRELGEELEAASLPAEVEQARARVRQAEARLAESNLPLGDLRLETLARALDLVRTEGERRERELELRWTAQSGELDVARAELARLEEDSRRLTLRAPAGGVVTSLSVSTGQHVQPGQCVLHVGDEGGLRVDALVPSRDRGELDVEMPARVVLDSFDRGRHGALRGTIRFVSADTQVRTDAAGGGAAVYLVQVEVEEAERPDGDLFERVRWGMSCQVEVVTRRESLLSLFFGEVRSAVRIDAP